MRLLVLFLLIASPAFAVGPPGPPPWHCSAWAACDDEACVQLPSTPLGIEMHEIQENLFRVRGFREDDRFALRADTEKQALAGVSAETTEPISLVLKPTDKVADAHGFELYSVGRRGTGEHVLSDGHILIACNSIR